MAITNRNAARILALHDGLHEAPYEFDFYQVMRLLECVHSDAPRIGESLRPRNDPVRFGQEPSLIFAPTTLRHFSLAKDGKKPHLSVLHFGLFGPNGPLPLHITEYVKDRIQNSGDTSFRGFADLFHHRMLSLFYRAWANTQPAISYDRPEEDTFSTYIGAVTGIGMPAYRQRDDMPDLAKLSFSGWLSGQTKSADGLEAMIQSFFELPTTIEQFTGHWMQIPEEGQCRLGESPTTGTLGTTSIIGEKVWDRQNKFRITIGPLTREQFEALLPGSDGLKRLIAIVRNYSGNELTWDLRLIMQKPPRPIRLGEEGQLGWNSWISGNSGSGDYEELILNPFAGTH
ncbi:type VI secretion system baseplate subunit TssG [Vibrio albus]|uniref:Type VI secretion system baseplate subunit TssG n=1 Tax=Vibrio albus TaxID=2200953 RepID=A0A2U3BBD8_9VIBR|nr:type VI secretion system baseplate subunit TssG [Vibrio albus]PWI34097.1 type VI secretion system baseplate subunit TssG [Vibrio albus]